MCILVCVEFVVGMVLLKLLWLCVWLMMSVVVVDMVVVLCEYWLYFVCEEVMCLNIGECFV